MHVNTLVECPRHMRLLQLLSESGPMFIGNAQQRLCLMPSQLTRMVSLCWSRKLISREEDPDDLRRTRIDLTPTGAMVLESFVREAEKRIR